MSVIRPLTSLRARGACRRVRGHLSSGVFTRRWGQRRLPVIRLALLLAAGAGLAGRAAAASGFALPSVTVTATGSIASTYVFRGLRLNAMGFQPGVELTSGGLALGTWANFPLRDKVRNGADPEFDFYGAYTFSLGDTLTVAPGFTSYHFPHAPTDAGFYRSTFEPNLAFSYTVRGIRFTPKIYYDVVLEGPTAELAATYAYPLARIGSELDFVAMVGTYRWRDFANDADPRVKAWGDYWLLSVSAPFQVTPTSRLTLGFAYTEGRDAFLKAGVLGKKTNPRAAGRGVVTLSFARTF